MVIFIVDWPEVLQISEIRSFETCNQASGLGPMTSRAQRKSHPALSRWPAKTKYTPNRVVAYSSVQDGGNGGAELKL